ncbi:hypothetical protein [Corynebacterium sp. A21]|uniref:hypothetical protein n=1 Tax=Corynebacterium sp. A21 TaxID=3457318 RepID=UPI003FD0128A
MTTSTSAQDLMIERLIATASTTARETGTALTLRAEGQDVFIISSTENHHSTDLFTATSTQLLEAIEQWSEETIKHWENDFPVEHLNSAKAARDERWEQVNYDSQTAEVVLDFTGELIAIAPSPLGDTIDQYLHTVRVTTDVATLISLTRSMFKDSQPDNPQHAFFPGSGGDEQLIEALSDAKWTVTHIDGDLHYIATAPNGTQLAYIEGDIEANPVENRPTSITLPTNLDLWRMMDAFIANRDALSEADATGSDTEPLSEAMDDMAIGIATAVINAAVPAE